MVGGTGATSEPSGAPDVPDGLSEDIYLLFSAASLNITDVDGRPVFKSDKRKTPSVAKVKEFFGLRTEFSNWTKNNSVGDSPDAQLRRTQKILQILSGDYFPKLPKADQPLYRRICLHWQHSEQEIYAKSVGRLRNYQRELEAYSLQRKKFEIEKQQSNLPRKANSDNGSGSASKAPEVRIFLDEPPVGREEILREALEFLRGGRGVIISGAPGQGKTTLARYLSLKAIDTFASENWFSTGVFEVDLESEREIDNLPKAIASVLGEASAPNSFDFLKSKSCLLLLDGADSIVNATDQLVLAREINRISDSLAPKSRVIITCQRILLKSQGGFRTIELGPLDPHAAVQLFHKLSDCRYKYRDQEEVFDFVNGALSGHPLSIRIVAGYGSALNISLSELVRLWHEKWDALDAAQFAIDERGLRASFELTFESLANSAKMAFLLLSLFPDGITLAQTKELWPEGYERFYGDLITLKRLSLLEERPLRRSRAVMSDENLEVLGRLRGPLFQFSRSRWIEEDREAAKLYGRSLSDLKAATDKYFDEYVRVNAPQYADPDPLPKNELIRHQFHNIHASLDRRLEPAVTDGSIGAANSVLSLYWAYHNNLSGANSPVSSTREATSYLRKAKDVFSANSRLTEAGRCIYYIGNILWLRGDIVEARRFLQDVLESDDADEKMLCDTKRAFAHIEYKEGSIPRSVERYKEVMSEAERIGYEACSVKCRVGLIDAYRKLGEYSAAIETFCGMEKDLEHYESEKGTAIRGYAYVLSMVDELKEARTQYRRAIECFESNAFGLAHCYRGLGDVLVKEGDLSGAESSFSAALEYYSDARKNPSLGVGLVILGQARLDIARGEFSEALCKARKAAELFDRQNLNEPYELASAHELVGDIHVGSAHHDQARASYELAILQYRRVGAEKIAGFVEQKKSQGKSS